MFYKRLSVVLAAVASALISISPSNAQTKAYKWRMAIRDGGMLAEFSQIFADRLKASSGGRMDITVYPPGTLGNALRVTDTVKSGVADVGHNWLGADWGKNSAVVLIGGYPSGLTDVQMVHWLYEASGQDLTRQLREQDFGVISFVAGMSTAEVFMHANKPIRSLSDFKGVKVRSAGAWLDMLKTLGASPISVAGADVYPMLERGAIDATEWSTPAINFAAGFHKIAKFVVVPGLHQPASTWEVAFAKPVWDALTPADQKLIELTAKLTTYETWTRIGQADTKAFQEFVKNGNTVIELDDGVRKEVARISAEWSEKQSAQNPWFKRIYESQKSFRESWKDSRRYRETGY